MPITIGNGNINVNSGLKTITDVAGKQIKGGIAFDGSNLRISAKENFIRKISNRSTKGELADLYKNNKGAGISYAIGKASDEFVQSTGKKPDVSFVDRIMSLFPGLD